MTHPAVVPPSSSPKVIACFKFDTLGDLVLFEPALRALRREFPAARLVVWIRRAYADLAALLGPDYEWRTTSIDPFAHGPEAAPDEVRRLREEIAALKPDVVAATTSKRNWLEAVLAATSGAPRRLAVGCSTDDEFFATQARLLLNVETRTAYTDALPTPDSEPDWRRNFVLLDALAGRPVPRQRPSLSVPPEFGTSAAAVLQERNLSPGKYIVCAAAGFANVAIKTWPPERFAAVLAHAGQQHGLPALLIGHESERSHLEKVASGTNGAAQIWCGGEGSLPLLAALIHQSRIFLGNDTGALHLAAALDRPVVGVFGGGTWPRFVPAARQHASIVHPLPCFGCGWDCAFGDAPCIGEIRVDDVTGALDTALARGTADLEQISAVQHLPPAALSLMDKAAIRYRETRREHLARQHKLEELTALDREKDAAIHEKEASIAEKEAEIDQKETALHEAERSMQEKDASIREKEKAIHEKEGEIAALRKVCDERMDLIVTLDRNSRALQVQVDTVLADKALLEKTLQELPPDHGHAVKTIAGQATHIRNLEALVHLRSQEIAELKATAANLASGLGTVEQAKHYGKLLAEKEAVIRSLDEVCRQREAVIRQLAAEATPPGRGLWKTWVAVRAFWRARIGAPLQQWLRQRLIENHWMKIGALRHYDPRPLKWDGRLPRLRARADDLPQIGIVTPSYGQDRFIERTMRSVLDQKYPKLRYVVQDGGSKDRSPEIISRYADRLQHWESVRDNGQADAIRRGFAHLDDKLEAGDVMAWLNSDDLLGPGVLGYVGAYFARHPEVDVIYGHRIIVDEEDREVGRWIMPPHDPEVLEWIDYVPQETLFWRKRLWDVVGGIDPTFQFALDWDLLARFQQAGARIVRVPYFLGAFRVHSEQKTSQAIHTVGADEMRRVRMRFHGEKHDDPQRIQRFDRQTRDAGVITARLLELGIRR
jgi:ADP-heptose:LPS heptosyltransferase/GT2 family glycosyltransferase